MPRSAARLLAPLFLATALAIGVATPAAAAPPKAWAGDVCAAVDQWVHALQKRAKAATAHVTRRAGPSKKSLLRMLASARGDTNELLARLRSSGSPSAGGGKQVATTTRDAFKQVARTIAQTRTALQKTKPKQVAKFADRARRAQDGLENGLERVEGIFGSTQPFDTEPLLAGFAKSSACRRLSKTTTVSIASIDPAAGPPGTIATYTFENVDAEGAQKCVDSSAYRVELLAPEGAKIADAGEQVEIPSDAPNGASTFRVVCYFPGKYTRPLMRSLCGGFEVTAPGVAGTSGGTGVPCPPTGRVLDGDAVIAAQRALGDGFNVLVGTIYGP